MAKDIILPYETFEQALHRFYKQDRKDGSISVFSRHSGFNSKHTFRHNKSRSNKKKFKLGKEPKWFWFQ